MIRSLTEIEAMILKAARGAGMPLGHAEDFAVAGRFLAATRPAQLDAIGTALGADFAPAKLQNDCLIDDAATAISAPLAIDTMLCGVAKIRLQGVDAPALFHAYLAVACHERGLQVDVLHNGRTITLTASSEVEVLRAKSAAVEVSDEIWTVWDSYAANTYVPATEASRLAGAGAGLTDND